MMVTMRKLATSIVVAVLVVTLLISGLSVGCQEVGVIGVKGSGNLETQNFNFSDFTRVDIGSAFEVNIVQSDSYDVSITTDDNLFKYIQVSKVGETLKIGLKMAQYIDINTRAEISMPQLRGLELSGATYGTVSGFSSTESLDVELSGASSLDLAEMSAGDVKFNIFGASKVTGKIVANDTKFNIEGASIAQLEGSASGMTVDAEGSSRVELSDFTVENVAIKLSGASTGTVNVYGRLDADLGEASKLSYIGEPTIGTIKTSGASTLSWE